MNRTDQTTNGCEPVEIRVAATEAEYETAFSIAYQVYHPLGFTHYSPHGMRVAQAQLEPGCLVLLAYCQNRPVATLSLYEDGPNGLPSECGWGEDIARLRAKGKRLVEIGTLMVLPGWKEMGIRICLSMFRAAWLYARQIRKADTICAFVQTKHVLFYKRMLTFETLGEPKPYEWNGLNFSEVVALRMDLTHAEEIYRARFERFGNSSRNLYHWFVVHRRKAFESGFRSELERRHGTKFTTLRHRFLPYLDSDRSPAEPSSRIRLDAASSYANSLSSVA